MGIGFLSSLAFSFVLKQINIIKKQYLVPCILALIFLLDAIMIIIFISVSLVYFEDVNLFSTPLIQDCKGE